MDVQGKTTLRRRFDFQRSRQRLASTLVRAASGAGRCDSTRWRTSSGRPLIRSPPSALDAFLLWRLDISSNRRRVSSAECCGAGNKRDSEERGIGEGEIREAELSYLRLKLRNPDAVSFGVSRGQSGPEKTGGGWPGDAGQGQAQI